MGKKCLQVEVDAAKAKLDKFDKENKKKTPAVS